MSKNIEPASTVHYSSGIITPTTGSTVLAAYDDRRTIIIQNLGTNTLYIKLGANASTSDFNFILKAGTATDDGLGGTFLEDVLSYTGPVSVAGASPRLTASDI